MNWMPWLWCVPARLLKSRGSFFFLIEAFHQFEQLSEGFLNKL